MIIDDFRIVLQIRIFFLKYCQNLFCMFMIPCKNDRLPDFLTIINFQSIRHYNIQNLTNRIHIKNPFI